MAARNKNDFVSVLESKNNTIIVVYSKTPVLFFFGPQLFGFKRGMNGVLTKKAFSPFRLLLN